MNKEDKYGLLVLLAFGLVGCLLSLWISNTSFCLNFKKDISDYTERFKWCATKIDYTK